jgi:hypothetical protein
MQSHYEPLAFCLCPKCFPSFLHVAFVWAYPMVEWTHLSSVIPLLSALSAFQPVTVRSVQAADPNALVEPVHLPRSSSFFSLDKSTCHSSGNPLSTGFGSWLCYLYIGCLLQTFGIRVATVTVLNSRLCLEVNLCGYRELNVITVAQVEKQCVQYEYGSNEDPCKNRGDSSVNERAHQPLRFKFGRLHQQYFRIQITSTQSNPAKHALSLRNSGRF